MVSLTSSCNEIILATFFQIVGLFFVRAVEIAVKDRRVDAVKEGVLLLVLLTLQQCL